ncbi:site-specific integrase [Mycobacterium paragordonae]|uniref:Prophage phiRv2 integrase n=1 Tax=Mycobacterium paragordonae TaxID=1389713 RepID=A0ABQ1C3K9_9MYCO|nr:site-specific integrase [Mycobacterium paragordonae]AYE95358.1 site-specific integrase [Mycobacterium paragordonae]GFG78558.1 putative prophage phiRv2 integrase [Mycobacterium paragordonae]
MTQRDGTKKRDRRKFGRIRQFNSGRWQASYTGPDGQVYIAPKTFDAKVDAEAWLTDRRREIDRELWSPESGQEERPGAPFGEYAEAWLRQRGIKDRTREHYRRLLDSRLLPTFGDTELRDITPAAVRRWYAVTAVGTPTMRAHAYSLLRSIMSTAHADDLIDSNPCRIRGATTSGRVHKIRPATLSEIETIANAMPDAYQALILMAAWLALRFGELTELRRKDIDLSEEVVRVRRAVVRVNDNFKVTTPKSAAGMRDIAIPPHLVPMIESHLRRHVQGFKDSLLFPSVTDPTRHLAPSALYRMFYKAREEAGRPDLRVHDLRHTGATLAAATGATLAELMGRLGHSTAGAALKYQHIAGGRDREIAALLSKLADNGDVR